MLHSHIQHPCRNYTGLLSAAAAFLPAIAQATVTNEGTAYTLDDGAAAYRESHLFYESNGVRSRLVLYRCMDGSVFARKTVLEGEGAITPDFDFIDGRTGHREGVRTTANGREVYWQKSARFAEKNKALDVPVDAVIDAGFDTKIRAQWTRLAGETGISAHFLLPSAMRFFKVGIERVQGNTAIGVTRLRMKLDTWYGFAAPDTELDYRNSDRRMLRFKGIGSIRDMKGRVQAVRIEFPEGLQGRQARTGEIEVARNLPLTGRCGA